jgi:membrane protease YdiL (CAAX protease family)
VISVLVPVPYIPAVVPDTDEPAAARVPLRWGIPDTIWAYVAGLAGAIVCSIPFSRADAKAQTAAYLVAVAIIGQDGATVFALWLISRLKGSGSVVRDFGLRLWVGDLWVVPAGAGLAAVLSALVYPLSEIANGREQEVVSDLKDASGARLVVFVVIAGLLAPVVEEFLFRGLLLRGLLRRVPVVPAVAISGLVFGLVHLTGDASLGTVAAFPALVTLGVISGVLAVRSGDLSRSIMLHAGFNLLTILTIVL